MQNVYINTWGREHIWSLDQMPSELRQRVTLCANEEWIGILKKKYKDVHYANCPIVSGAAESKQWTLEYAKRHTSKDCPVIIMLDDDLWFVHRTKDGKFPKATEDQVQEGFERLERAAALDGVGFASFSTSFFNPVDKVWGLCKQICGGFFINRETLKRTGARFDGIPTREDIHFSAANWSQGFPSLSLYEFCTVNKGDSTIGGESSIDPRTGDLSKGVMARGPRTEKAINQLHEMYPNHVKLSEKRSSRAKAIGNPLSITVYGYRMYVDALKRLGKEKIQCPEF